MNASFLDLLRSRQSFLLTGHEHPDGDCLGSQVGLYHLLKQLGATVRIFNPDPVARSLGFLAERTPIGNYRDSSGLPDFDVAILLDCAHLSRLGDMGVALRAARRDVAVIDHHVGSEEGDGQIHFVDVSAAATGVLVHDLFREFGVEIPEVAAEAIFVAIVSDTGWFRYSNTDRRTMTIAAEMIDRGVKPDKLYDRLFRANAPEFVGLLSDCLSTHEYRLGGRFGFAVLDHHLMGRINRSGFDADSVLEPIRSVEGVEVAALFKELSGGVVKLSLRSMGELDVQSIAADFGGGGHVKAAGATIGMALVEAVDAVEDRVRQALKGTD